MVGNVLLIRRIPCRFACLRFIGRFRLNKEVVHIGTLLPALAVFAKRDSSLHRQQPRHPLNGRRLPARATTTGSS